MSLVGVAIAPHPPILIPEIGRGEEKKAHKTLNGMKKMAEYVAGQKPEIIVVISPHGNMFSDGFCILDAEELEGDFSDFGYLGYHLRKRLHRPFLEKMKEVLADSSFSYLFMTEEDAQFYRGSMALDHGALVPLYFIEQVYQDYKLVHIAPGDLGLEETHRFGTVLERVASELDQRVLVLASADLSHCLKDSGPYHYAKEGPIFDQILVESIRAKRYDDLTHMKPHLYEPAGQCGLRSIVMALGSVDGMKNRPEVFSYEGPYGVGYMTGAIHVTGEKTHGEIHRSRDQVEEDPYVHLARRSVEHWTREGTLLNWDEYKKDLKDETFVEEMENTRAGAFVSIHKNNQLRGCIGTIEATKENLALEIIQNGVEASSFDPRFPAVEPWELAELEIKVDVLKKPEPIQAWTELDPVRYGVIVEKGSRRGLLLPNLEGVDTVEAQLDIAMQKAGIMSLNQATVYRFEVIRYEN
ncbi:AmmeMemoRadiSam system protein A [Alkalibacter rhizosphaerae]|uniref:AmmeMemoRadiSam system protein A n=1 Tax=Alkalibacter rhizosphaerae TaxID=2815577 RepID=A0A974XDD7_9FIRM|nr:AmmeMemoRadiSam system protein A [Alkalibacter rhizosphaerae]QSX07753.1 AmmeMemoRadiSam system protein A [Alkalibacter rhizosphaerae]